MERVTVQEQWPSEPAGPLPARLPPKHEAIPKRVLATIGFLADASRRRRTGRFALWGVVLLLAVAGVAMLSYPFYTQYYAHRKQAQLSKEFAQLQSPAEIQAYKLKQLQIGDPLTRIIIPKIKVNVIVVEGVSGNALRAGAGHYESSSLPGDFGNVAIAGHRTGFGAPFRNIDKLTQGDEVVLITPIGRYTYQVMGPFDGHSNPWVTVPTDLSVTQPTAEPSLTLTTCDPPHTSLNRLIVRAKLVKSETAA